MNKSFMFLVCLMVSMAGFAQENQIRMENSSAAQESISIRPTIGTTITDLRVAKPFGDNFNVTPQAGISVGVGLLIPSLNPYLSYETGLFYGESKTQVTTQYGINGTITADTITTFQEINLTLKRFTIPFFLRVYPGTHSSGFYLKGGIITHIQESMAYTGYNETSSSNALSQRNVSRESFSSRSGYDDGLRPIVLDGALGVGYEFGMKSGLALMADLTYQRGLLGVAIEDNDLQADAAVFNFGIGF